MQDVFRDLRTGIVLLFLIAGIPTISHADSAFQCAAGGMSHAASQREANAVGEGIIAGVTQVCGSDAALGINDAAGAAKEYLLSIARNLRDSQAPPDKAHIDPLNNSFAICEAKFLDAYTREKGPIYVVSAFRCGPYSPAIMRCDRTENARAGGVSGSNHQLGLAVDVFPADGDYAKAQAFARSNPQYGVWFRLGMGDKPHMEPVNKNAPSCDGVAGTPAPTLNGTYSGLFSGTPSSALTGASRNYLAPTPAYYQPPQYQQALPQTQQPFQYTQPPTQPTPTPTSSYLYLNRSADQNTEKSTNAKPHGPSALELIEQLAGYPTSTRTITTTNGTSGPIVLNTNVQHPASTTPGQTTHASTTVASSTSVLISPYTPAQTFTSSDLAGQRYAPSTYSPQQLSLFQQVLTRLRDVLVSLLHYLQPFKSRFPQQESLE